MFQTFAKPRFRPAINVGCLMDVMTGQYETGIHGESILNGGVSGITGICARPNNFKTALAVYLLAMVRRACHNSHSLTYDSEGTLYPVSRFTAVSKTDSYLSRIDYRHDNQFAFTDISQYNGDEFFDRFSKVITEKGKNAEKYLGVTPFVDEDGKAQVAIYPSTALIDSLSRMTVSSVEAIYDKNKIGDSGMNTEAMNAGRAKKQMFNQLPQLCAKNGTYLVMTAHVKDKINMEMFPKDTRNLSFMKQDTVLEGVSGGFYSLPNNLMMVVSNKPLQTKDKTPEYPKDNKTAMAGDTDLVVITMMNLRGKNGLSGFPIDLVISQAEGVKAELTNFHFCKDHGRFGLGGNLQNYHMELRPDVSLSRTKVRFKLEEDSLLARAAEFTSEMLQMRMFHRTMEERYLIEPKDLYQMLKDQGHDWDTLLNTRGYWVFDEERGEHDRPFLSTMDLLRMATGEYIPYWYTKEQKAALKTAK